MGGKSRENMPKLPKHVIEKLNKITGLDWKEVDDIEEQAEGELDKKDQQRANRKELKRKEKARQNKNRQIKKNRKYTI